jgi:hypothetical protein
MMFLSTRRRLVRRLSRFRLWIDLRTILVVGLGVEVLLYREGGRAENGSG